MEERNRDNPIHRLVSEKTSKSRFGKIRNSDDFTFFGITKTKNGDAQQSLALKLILQNGEQLMIQYHELVSPMKFNGSDLIQLSTPILSIEINGNNLENIFDYLGEFRVVWMKEPDGSFMEKNEEEASISRISINPIS